MMRTPDGHGRIELTRFLAPPVVADHRNAPVNALQATCVSCSPWTTSTIRSPGSADTARSSSTSWSSTRQYRLCYVRGPEGILIGLAEQIG